jgi:hypothetical protein
MELVTNGYGTDESDLPFDACWRTYATFGHSVRWLFISDVSDDE